MSNKLQGYIDYVDRDEALDHGFDGSSALFTNYLVNTGGWELPDDLEKGVITITRKISSLFWEYCDKKFKNPEAAEEYYQEAKAKLELIRSFREENEYPNAKEALRDEKLKVLIQKFMDEVYGKL